jgi:hypothetical protein
MKVERQGDWLTAKIGDEIVMMNAKNSKYIGLSRVGARIWEIMERADTVEEICAILVAQFKVTPETCRDEVDNFLSKLAQQGAVVFEPAQPPER